MWAALRPNQLHYCDYFLHRNHTVYLQHTVLKSSAGEDQSTNCVKHKEVLCGVKEEWNILHTLQ